MLEKVLHRLVKFYEHQKRSKKELKDEGLNERDIARIKSFNKRQRKIMLKVLDEDIKATSYVGIFAVGRKIVQILPKIARSLDENSVVKNLLYMLHYTKNLEIIEADVSVLCERKRKSFFEIIIYLFSKNLLELVKRNYFKNYVTQSKDLGFVKGKILFHENIKRMLSRRDKIHCLYSEFSSDVLMNQIFKYTVFLLKNLSSDYENIKLLRQLEFMFSDISSKMITVYDFERLHLNRLNFCYKPFVDLSKLFISNSSVELTPERLETFSFVFDMNQLFQEFVARFIQKNKAELLSQKVKVKIQDTSKRLVDLPEPLFVLRPDILIIHKDQKLIIDTKYKILETADEKKRGVSQPDLYQVLAYGIKHNCYKIVLLYPDHLNKGIRPPQDPYVIKWENKEYKVFIRTVDLTFDLATEKNKLISQLRQICSLTYD